MVFRKFVVFCPVVSPGASPLSGVVTTDNPGVARLTFRTCARSGRGAAKVSDAWDTPSKTGFQSNFENAPSPARVAGAATVQIAAAAKKRHAAGRAG